MSERIRKGNSNKGAAHNRFKHGKTGGSLYRTWSAMKARCYRKTCPDYKNYGARGIKVCERWLHSFETFSEDMGDRPAGMTIERKDSNADYSPDNCIWASKLIQARNRRGVKISEQMATEIRIDRERGVTLSYICGKFNIGMSQASRICRNLSWPDNSGRFTIKSRPRRKKT